MKNIPELRIKVEIRNNLILEKIEAAGFTSIAEFCRHHNLRRPTLDEFIKLEKSPLKMGCSGKTAPEWLESVEKIAQTLNCSPEELFPEQDIVLRKSTASVKVRAETVWSAIEHNHDEVRALLPETVVAANDLRKALDDALMKLTEKEATVLRARFFEGKTLEEVSEMFDVTRERIRQIETRALRKLRHPSRGETLIEAGALDGEVLFGLVA